MSEFRYLAILLNGKPPYPKDAILTVLRGAKSWAMFSHNTWLIATEQDTSYWYDRVREVIAPTDDILVTEIVHDTHRGWVQNVIADWLRQDHTQMPGL